MFVLTGGYPSCVCRFEDANCRTVRLTSNQPVCISGRQDAATASPHTRVGTRATSPMPPSAWCKPRTASSSQGNNWRHDASSESACCLSLSLLKADNMCACATRHNHGRCTWRVWSHHRGSRKWSRRCQVTSTRPRYAPSQKHATSRALARDVNLDLRPMVRRDVGNLDPQLGHTTREAASALFRLHLGPHLRNLLQLLVLQRSARCYQEFGTWWSSRLTWLRKPCVASSCRPRRSSVGGI